MWTSRHCLKGSMEGDRGSGVMAEIVQGGSYRTPGEGARDVWGAASGQGAREGSLRDPEEGDREILG